MLWTGTSANTVLNSPSRSSHFFSKFLIYSDIPSTDKTSVDIIDATATMFSMVRFCGVVDDRDGDFPRSTLAYCCDAISISISALFGCSPVTAFIESGAGIAEGGRTGLTAMTTGFLFLLSIVFGPIFSSVPPWATGPALILVSCETEGYPDLADDL
jgi:xanthine/uracil/vitamin C permease (AzgA family)